MPRKISICWIVFVLLFSCSKDNKTAQKPTTTGSPSAPVAVSGQDVVSASLSPSNPTAQTRIVALYRLRDPGWACRFRWYVNGGIVQEGGADALEPGKFSKGASVFVEIIPMTPQGAGLPLKTEPVTIGNLPPVISSVSLQPVDPPVGAKITATATATDPDDDIITVTYQWFVNGKAVSEPRKNNVEFDTAGLKKKDLVYVVATPFDDVGPGDLKASDVIVLADSPPKIISTPQYNLQNGVYLYQVKTVDPDGDTLAYSLLTSPPGMTIDRSSGLVRWEPPKDLTEKKTVPIKISVDDGDGGTAVQEFSVIIDVPHSE